MKNKYILSAVLVTLFASVAANAQEGFGTNNPDPSSVIDMVSAKRGVLVPRIALTATNVAAPVTAPAEALWIYNTATAGAGATGVTPGFYYWSVNKWVRITSIDDITRGTISSSDIDVDGGTNAAFGDVKLAIANGAVTSDKIAPAAVTQDKLKAPAQTTGPVRVAVAQNDGTVTYESLPSTGVEGANLEPTQNDGSITVTNGTGTTLKNTKLHVTDGGITTLKIGADAVTNEKLADDAVQTENIVNGTILGEDIAAKTITADKLVANGSDVNKVATVNADGTVSYKTVAAGNVAYNDATTGFGNGVDTVQEAVEALASGTADQLNNFKLVDNANGTFSFIGKDGSTVVSTINKGTITANADGTYTFNNGGTPVTIDPSQVHVAYNNGVYTFTNAAGATITSIDVNANALPFNNSGTGLAATNVQAAIVEINSASSVINLIDENDGKVTLVKADGSKVKVGKGDITNNNDGTYTFANGDGSDVTINTSNLSISELNGVYTFKNAAGTVLGTINTNASALGYNDTTTNLGSNNVQGAIEALATKQSDVNNALNQINLVDNNDGKVTLIKPNGDAVTVDKSTLTLNANGTYTFNNGNGSPVTFDPTDVKITEAVSGVYTFVNNAGTVLGAINTNASALNFDNSGTGLTATNVQAAIAEVNANVTNQVNSLELKDNQNGTISLLSPDGTDLGTVNKADLSYNVATGKYTFTNGTGGSNVQFGGGNLTPSTGDTSIVVTDGTGATLKDASIKVADSGITEAKLASNSVTTSKIENGTILGEDIAPATVAAANLTSGTAANGTVATANGNGGVTYAAPSVTAGNVTGTGNIESTDITVDNGENSALKTVKLTIAENAVTSAKIANGTIIAEDLASNSVTTAKIENGTILGEDIAPATVAASNLTSGTAANGTVATANGNGGVTYAAPSVTAGNVTGTGNIESTDITVDNGENSALKTVKLAIAENAITSAKIANGTIIAEDLASNSVTTAKIENGTILGEDIAPATIAAANLTSGTAANGTVATANGNGGVTYAAPSVTAGNVTGTGKIESTDITVGNGENSVLKDVTLTIAENAITTDKIALGAVESSDIKNGTILGEDIAPATVAAANLTSGTAANGTVATANGNGGVTYAAPSVTAGNVTGTGKIESTDITVGNGENSVLKDVTLTIAENAVTSAKIANGTIIAEDLASNSVTTAKIENGTILGEDIAPATVGSANLTSGTAANGTVATANGNGGVTYAAPSVTAGNVTGAQTLSGDESITVTDGSGATLRNTSITVAAGGINDTKLATGAVTNVKLGADAITTDKIALGAVESSDIKNGTILGEDIAPATVGSANLTSGTAANGTVATANGNGGVTYAAPTVTAGNVSGTGKIESTDITVGNGENSVLKDVTLTIAENAVTSAKIANGTIIAEDLASNSVTTSKIENGTILGEDIAPATVTAANLTSGTAANGTVATANGNGGVTYAAPSVTAGNVTGTGKIESTDITVGNGENSVLKDVTLTIAENAITTDKIALGAVESSDIKNGTILGEDIAPAAVAAANLTSGTAANGTVATANGNGGVTYAAPSVTAGNVTGAQTLSGDASITVTDGSGATLRNTSITVAAGGINDTKLATGAVTNVKLGADAITTDKIALGAVESSDIKNGTILGEDIAPATVAAANLTSDTAANGTVATANGNGGVTYAAPTVTAGNVSGTGGITSSDITVGNGGNSTLKDVTLAIANGAITPAKLNSQTAANGTVATANGNGGVTYAAPTVTAGNVSGSGGITSSDIAVGNGGNSTLKDVTLAIANGAITPAKLNSQTAASGTVATANGNGGVTYAAPTVTAGNVSGTGNIESTDITVSNGQNSALKTVTLAIAANAVTTGKILNGTILGEDIAPATVGAGNLSSGTAANGTVATANGNGGVTYAAPSVTAGNVSGSGGITSSDITVGNGGNSTLKDVTLAIANGAITPAKLNSQTAASGTVATANGSGGVTYAAPSVTAGNVSGSGGITSSDITVGNGGNSTLKDVTLAIANGAITPAKLNSQTAASGTVATANGSGGVTYAAPSVTAGNVTGRQNLSAADPGTETIEVATGGTNAVLVATTLRVKDNSITAGKIAPKAVTVDKINNGTANQVLATNNAGNAVTWVDKSTLAIEPWQVQGTANQAINNTQAIYQQGNVGIGFTSTDAVSSSALDVKAGTVKVREIRNAYTGATTDKVVVADNTGVLRTTNAAMPKVFYMPAVVFNTSTQGSFTRDLYAEYLAQFTEAGNSTFVKSNGAPSEIPHHSRTELNYYITYYDTAVFQSLQMTADGVLTGNIVGPGTEGSYMNIVFVVK